MPSSVVETWCKHFTVVTEVRTSTEEDGGLLPFDFSTFISIFTTIRYLFECRSNPIVIRGHPLNTSKTTTILLYGIPLKSVGDYQRLSKNR